MTSTPRIHDLFLEAIDLEPDRRAGFVEACSPDPALRRRLTELLEAHDDAPDFLETAAVRAPILDLPADLRTEGIGGSIGRYKLLQQIGEGGFGVVYMAEQQEPVRRRVALKIIKLGMDTKQVIGRFEAERQALAMMDHPNIAKVLDAGATETGRPYFVMELVKGIPITEYCDQHNLTVTERLGLFQLVCHAVQHAHQKGIIHRDLKPSNIMVTLHDGQPVPKVIDFGIAKAMNQKLTERTVFTEFRQFIGTPDYMSPEQADISGLDVDTRSDIYALGVLLYELLTGVTPFDPQKLRDAAYGEIQRIIREDHPPKPSTRLTALDTRENVAARRGSEPGKLGVLIRGELDWIVMRAMEKDRTRRYETANGLAKDVERYLSDEPVVAGPPSATYRMRKFVHRNRAAVMVASVVLFCLVSALSATLVGLKAVMDSKEEIAAERDRADRAWEVFGPSELSLAVRPLDNASGDPAQDYFADGMTRALIGELERVDAIEVRSFQSVAKLADSDRTDAEIARDLGVDLLLTGSVARLGDRVEMRVSLAHEAKNENLMRETYAGPWSDVFDLQRRAADDTLRAVRLTAGPDQATTRTVKKGDTTDPRARDLYDRGAHNLMAPDGADLDRAIEFFDQAIAIDSRYAQAHLGKAKACLMKATLGVSPDEFNPPALEAARAAIAIDDTLSDAWAVLGQIQLSFLYEWADARKSLERALLLDPDNPEAHVGMAASCISAGEVEAGTGHLKRAIEIDPAILLVNEATTYLAFFARDYDLAVSICEHALDLDKDWWAPKAWMGLALGCKGESTRQAGIALLEEAVEMEEDSPIALACLAGLYAADGQKTRAREHLEYLKDWAGSRYICPYEIATVLIALGDYEGAFDYLHDAVDASSECMPFIGMDVRLDPLRDDPELDQIMRGIQHPLFGKPKPWLQGNEVRAPSADDA